MKGFKTMNRKKPINSLKDYLANFLIDNPDAKIYLSSDSQNIGKKTVHAVVIILYLKGRGGHVLYKKEYSDRVLFGKSSGTDFNKLFHEAQMLNELATYIKDNLNRKVDLIALDYNEDKKYFSNKVFLASIGWLSDKAHKVVGKPNYFSAAADKVVRT